jgi:pyruvate formate lyase activating enzyme
LGFDVKLDTNGQSARKLKLLAENKYIDYVAMDIKNSLENYGKAAGVEGLDTTQVEESIDFLLGGTIPYEFRTTVVREIHKIDDFHKIGQRLRGAKRYYLQTFKDPGNTLVKNLTAYSREEMEEFCEIVSEYTPEAELRG